MLTGSLLRLLERSADASTSDAPNRVWGQGARFHELHWLLQQKNGFYAYESALHVFPSGPYDRGFSLEEWNTTSTWKFGFAGMADAAFCFAEDIFGVQFAVVDEHIATFDPETGAIEVVAETLDDWALQMVDQYRVQTGYPLAHDWQVRHGALSEGDRLVPKIPFFAGGAFSIDNLNAVEAAHGMRYRGSIAVQIRDLPDGAEFQFTVS